MFDFATGTVCTRLKQFCYEFLGTPCLLNPTKLTGAMETTNFNSTSDMPYL